MEYKIHDPVLFRQRICTTLGNLVFGSSPESHETHIIRIRLNMEKSIYNFSIVQATTRHIIKKWENPTFVHLYVDKLRSIYHNLRNPHTKLAQRLATGDIPASQVAFLSHQEYFPQRWQSLLEEKHKRLSCKFNTEIQASTDVYQCKRCKSRKCIYTEQQVRSADESMTIFVTCLDCGKQWRC